MASICAGDNAIKLFSYLFMLHLNKFNANSQYQLAYKNLFPYKPMSLKLVWPMDHNGTTCFKECKQLL